MAARPQSPSISYENPLHAILLYNKKLYLLSYSHIKATHNFLPKITSCILNKYIQTFYNSVSSKMKHHYKASIQFGRGKSYLHLLPLCTRCNNPLFAVIYILKRSSNGWKGGKDFTTFFTAKNYITVTLRPI